MQLLRQGVGGIGEKGGGGEGLGISMVQRYTGQQVVAQASLTLSLKQYM